MAKENVFSVVLDYPGSREIRIGGLSIPFDGLKKFGVTCIPSSALKKLRELGVNFIYTDSFEGCFKTFVYNDGKSNIQKLRDKKLGRKDFIEEPVVEKVTTEEVKDESENQ